MHDLNNLSKEDKLHNLFKTAASAVRANSLKYF